LVLVTKETAVLKADLAVFQKIRDIGDDVPVAEVAVEIDVGDGAERGLVHGRAARQAGGEEQQGESKDAAH
jgi:hypothetical protein